MNTDNGALSFEAFINNDRLNSTALEAERRIRGLSSTAVTESERMDQAFSKLGAMVGAYFGFQALQGFVSQLVKVRGEFQQLDVAFTTMLGSKEKADRLMAQIVDTAAKTPFTLTEVAAGAKQLLAYQVAAEDVNETVIRLGNIASGVSVPLNRLILVYGQVKAKGRLMGDDLRQFTEAGVPIIHELAKSMGVADEQIQKMVEDGKIGFPQVQKVVENLTNAGGMFYNLMEKQSKTLTGQLSNLQDAWDRMLNSIGQSNEGFLSGAITGTTYLVDHYKEVLDVIVPLVATFGAYKAALIVAAVAQKAVAAATFVQEYVVMGSALGFATANQIAFNRAVLANPYALAIAAIVGLIAVIYELTGAEKELTETEKALKDVKDKAGAKYDDEADKIKNLVNVMQDERVSIDLRRKALEQIQAKVPAYHGSLTEEGKLINDNNDAIKEYLKSLERTIYLQATMDEKTELVKKKRDLEKKAAIKQKAADDAVAASKYTTSGGLGDVSGILSYQKQGFADNVKADLEAVNKAIAALDDEYAKISMSGGNAGKKVDDVITKNKSYWENVKKDATNARDALSDAAKGTAEWQKYTDQIAEADKHIQSYNTKVDAKDAKDEASALKDFNEEKLKVEKKYAQDELDLQRAKTTDKKKLIDIDLKQTLAGIDEMEKAYKEKAAKAGIKNPDVSIFGKMRSTATATAESDKSMIDVEAQKKALTDLLETYKDTEAKLLEIQRKYNEDSKTLVFALMNAKTDEERKQIEDAISERKKAFEKDKGQVTVDDLMKSTDWTSLFSNLDTMSVQKIIEIRDKLESEFSKLNLPPDQLKAIRDQLDKSTAEIEKKNPFLALSNAIKKYKEKDSKDNFTNVAKAASAVADAINTITDDVVSGLETMGVKMDDGTKQVLNPHCSYPSITN